MENGENYDKPKFVGKNSEVFFLRGNFRFSFLLYFYLPHCLFVENMIGEAISRPDIDQQPSLQHGSHLILD